MFATIAPVVVIAVLLAAPALLRRGKPSRFVRVQQALAVARSAMVQVRSGLAVFRQPRLGGWAALTQLSAWAVQLLACYVLLVALGLDERAGIGAAAAVLFAVNVTAALPATPVEPRRVPGRVRGRAVGVRRRQDGRAGLRDHPAGGGDRHRRWRWACPRSFARG